MQDLFIYLFEKYARFWDLELDFEYCKWGLWAILIGARKITSSAESNVDYRGPAQEVSYGYNINNWATEHLCDILANNVAAFCSKNLSEANLKSCGISEAEEIPRQPLE